MALSSTWKYDYADQLQFTACRVRDAGLPHFAFRAYRHSLFRRSGDFQYGRVADAPSPGLRYRVI